MINIKELIKSPEYEWLNKYKDRLCFLTIAGSHGYGTNVEDSDIDIRGVMLPTIEELIGLKTFNQKIEENTDSCIYEFNQFIKLASNCNPNIIELLGCKEYLIFNEIGESLLENSKLFLSKKAAVTFGGYAIAQLRRLENALYEKVDKNKQLNYVKETIENAMEKQVEKNKMYLNKSIIPKVIDNKLCFSVEVKDTPIEEIKDALNSMLDIHRVYNKINARNNKKDVKHLNKHIMHLVRLHYTCFDILEKHEIYTYRENERKFLLDIRNGKFLSEDCKLSDEFYPFLEELKTKLENLAKETSLTDKPNFNNLEKYVIDVNRKIIKNDIKKYEIPQELTVIY